MQALKLHNSAMKISIKRLTKHLPIPQYDTQANPEGTHQYRTEQIAAFDFFCAEKVVIPPRNVRLVSTGVAMAIPDNHFLLLVARSSTPWKRGLMLANGVGIIDPFYCGEEDDIKLQFLNITDEAIHITPGEALAQGIILQRPLITWQEVAHMPSNGHGGYHANTSMQANAKGKHQ